MSPETGGCFRSRLYQKENGAALKQTFFYLSLTLGKKWEPRRQLEAIQHRHLALIKRCWETRKVWKEKQSPSCHDPSVKMESILFSPSAMRVAFCAIKSMILHSLKNDINSKYHVSRKLNSLLRCPRPFIAPLCKNIKWFTLMSKTPAL